MRILYEQLMNNILDIGVGVVIGVCIATAKMRQL